MPEELFWRRPKNYSVWHRPPSLPKWCYLTDGDFFEQRVINGKLTVVAYFETYETTDIDLATNYGTRHGIWPSKRALIREIGEKMGIPTYIVVHNPQCTNFLVWKGLEDPSPKRMDEFQYKEFIENIGGDYR